MITENCKMILHITWNLLICQLPQRLDVVFVLCWYLPPIQMIPCKQQQYHVNQLAGATVPCQSAVNQLARKKHDLRACS